MGLEFVVTGLFVGMMVGMTGVGGGSLMTPILIFGFSVQPAIAVGTDLLFAAITKAGGIWTYWRLKAIDWRVVALLAMGSIPATIITLWLLTMLGLDADEHSKLITKALGFALILTSTAILLKLTKRRLLSAEKIAFIKRYSYIPKLMETSSGKASLTIVTGAFIGVMVTVSSVGAGAVGTAVLLFLYAKMRPVEIVGTDIAHAVPLTLLAGMGHAVTGTVDYELLAYLLIGSLPGIFIGARLGSLVPERVMRATLATILLLVGIKCLL